MKAFISSIFKFLLFPIAISVTLFFSDRYCGDFSISPKYQTIILGHSHPECAYNDNILTATKNLAESGESYFYTYIKAKQVIEQNTHLKSVLIEFSNNQITQRMDEWIWADNYLQHKLPILAAHLDLNSMLFLLNKNTVGFINATPNILKRRLKMAITKYDYSKMLGGYLHLERDFKNIEEKKHLETTLTIKADSSNISFANITYLRKLVDYAKENQLKVYLIRSPLHENFGGRANEIIFQEIRKANFSDVEFLDFSNFPLSNSEFGDHQHLNYKGAKTFSSWFQTLTEMGLFSELNKQEFIDSEIDKYKVLLSHTQEEQSQPSNHLKIN